MKRFLLLFLGICFFVVSCSVGDKKTGEHYPLLGLEPIANVPVFDDQKESLILWAGKGPFKGMPVVHVGMLDGLGVIPPERVRQIRLLVSKARREKIESSATGNDKGLFTSRDFLYAAASVGMIKKVYWIIPDRLLEYSDAELRVQRYLEAVAGRFRREDIDRMKFGRGCVSGMLNEVDVSVCNLETMPSIQGPILLDLDTGFISRFSAGRNYSKLRGLKEIFDSLASKRLRVAAVNVSLNDIQSKSIDRYIGNQAAEALLDPAVMKSTTPPELWSARDNIDEVFFRNGNIETALKGSLKKYPEDRPLILFGAVSAALKGKEQQAFHTLDRLCREEEGACYAFLYTGIQLKKNHMDSADRFLERAAELDAGRPDMVPE